MAQSSTQKPDNQLSKKNGEVIALDKGRIPPQAIDMEEAVLGAMLIDNAAIGEVIDILNAESFYKEAHKIIYGIIKELFSKSEPVDILTVGSALRKEGQLQAIGGDYYLVQLSQKVSSSAHSEYHARIIMQKYLQREMIHLASDIVNKAFDETSDVFELLDESEQALFDVAHKNVTKNYESADNLIAEAIRRIEEVSKKEGLSGVPSGLMSVDQVTGGWQPSDLIVIAARPAMGKTAMVLSMARNMSVDHNIPVALFSLEMSSVQLITRLISGETGIESDKLRKGNLEPNEWQQLLSKVRNLENAPLYIDDTPALSVFDLRAKCRRLVAQKGVKVIIVDYLQLMTAGTQAKQTGNREQEISTISRSLKSIAKEMNVPVLALAQLSRAVETRGGDKRPILSDLRESGAIEQDADIVSFIYRPEYYQIDEWPDGSPTQNQGELIIAKHRNGGTSDVRLSFYGRLARFSDLEHNLEGGEAMQFQSKMNHEDDAPEQDLPPDFNGPDGENLPF